MRRAGVIVALGALAGMLGAALTASPALARGPQWQVLPLAPFTLPASFCGFEVAVSAPGRRQVLQASQDPGQLGDLPADRLRDHLRHEPGDREDRDREHLGPGDTHHIS
jgi:hypothetical protein